jgi:TolA-binding protein
MRTTTPILLLRTGSAAVVLLAAAFLTGCASTAPQGDRDDSMDGSVPAATWEEETSEAVEALRRAVEASYDRERGLAERLRETEEDNGALSQELAALRTQSTANRAQLDSLGMGSRGPQSALIPQRAVEDEGVLAAYQDALEQYRARRYPSALDRFGDVLAMAPYGRWADNAQYWRGECFYGMGRYRQSLTEFTKVFVYEKTEKADDAQLKVARCYLALGEKERALTAFQKLLDEYPESEYVEVARKEMRYLQGQ